MTVLGEMKRLGWTRVNVWPLGDVKINEGIKYLKARKDFGSMEMDGLNGYISVSFNVKGEQGVIRLQYKCNREPDKYLKTTKPRFL